MRMASAEVIKILCLPSSSDVLKSLEFLASGLAKSSPVLSYCCQIQICNITQLQYTVSQGSASDQATDLLCDIPAFCVSINLSTLCAFSLSSAMMVTSCCSFQCLVGYQFPLGFPVTTVIQMIATLLFEYVPHVQKQPYPVLLCCCSSIS